MDYRAQLGLRLIMKRKGSLIAASLAVAIAILVILVNSVIFNGVINALVRDLTNYRFGHVFITDKEDYITKSDFFLINWLQRIPEVEAATPRLESTASINATKFGQRHEEFKIPVMGVDPINDLRASTIHTTVGDGQFVFTRNSIVIGSTVARDLGGVKVGDSVKLKVFDRHGEEKIKWFNVVGISETAGGLGLDTSVVVHIDTLRELIDRKDESSQLLVRLNDPTKAEEIRDLFLMTFPNDDFKAETMEEAGEQTLRGIRSGVAFINLVGYFGMMSSAFAIVTIQMMQVSSKTREIGIMRAVGARKKDILMIFIFQGMVIGAIGAGLGSVLGISYTAYAKETHMRFNESLALEVEYNWLAIAQTATMAFLLAIIASIYPAYRATKLEPVEAIRFA